VNSADVQSWLDAYVEAWKSYEREAIEALFSEDVAYRYHPYDDPISGREEVVQSWLGEGEHLDASDRDEPGTYEAHYAPVAIDGDVAVATGSSTYLGEDGSVADVYHNCFVMRFDADGRCAEFTEWFIERPD
jgi:ketosteroid isomerase-like protein